MRKSLSSVRAFRDRPKMSEYGTKERWRHGERQKRIIQLFVLTPFWQIELLRSIVDQYESCTSKKKLEKEERKGKRAEETDGETRGSKMASAGAIGVFESTEKRRSTNDGDGDGDIPTVMSFRKKDELIKDVEEKTKIT